MTTYQLTSAALITADGAEHDLPTASAIEIEPPSLPTERLPVFNPKPWCCEVEVDSINAALLHSILTRPPLFECQATYRDGSRRRFYGPDPRELGRLAAWFGRYRNRIVARAGQHIGLKRRGSNGWKA